MQHIQTGKLLKKHIVQALKMSESQTRQLGMSVNFNVLNNFYVYVGPWDMLFMFSCLCSKVTVYRWKWQCFLVPCSRFPCEICNKTYQNKPDLTRPEKSGYLENPSGSKERFPCEIYNKPYKNKNGLKRHEKSEHLVNPSGSKERFTCEICNKTYKNNENPSGSKDRFPCELCNKTLKDIKSLNI